MQVRSTRRARTRARAGVESDVSFTVAPISALEPPRGEGWFVSNPPYGVRVGERDRLRNLYAQLGNVARAKLMGWTVGFLLADRRLESQIGLELRERFATRNGGIPVRMVVGAVGEKRLELTRRRGVGVAGFLQIDGDSRQVESSGHQTAAHHRRPPGRRNLMRQIARFMALAAAVVVGGCASRLRTGRVRDHGTLTKEQIAESHFTTAYDAVEALRSNWLHARGTDSFQTPSEVLVYLDNTRLGGTDRLREIAANTIVYMRFYDGVAATGRWGIGHSAGVIYVSTHAAGTDPAPPSQVDRSRFNDKGLRSCLVRQKTSGDPISHQLGRCSCTGSGGGPGATSICNAGRRSRCDSRSSPLATRRESS